MEYITVILVFWYDCIFSLHALVYTSFCSCSALSTKKYWTMNKPDIFGPARKICHKHLKYFSKCIEITPYHTLVFLSGTGGSKKEHEEVKDDFKSRRPSISRSEVNIKLIRHLVYSDHQLTVQMIASELGMKKDSVWKIIPKRFVYGESLCKIGDKTTDNDQKEHCMQMCQDI